MLFRMSVGQTALVCPACQRTGRAARPTKKENKMTRPVGRNIAISPFRRLVIDLMHFSQKVPSVTVERRMKLARLVDARQACMTRPTWYTLFTKAYAIVAARTPELRRSYLRYPWPHIYEHPRNLATLNLERMFGDEKIVIYALIRGPENRSLEEL